MEDLQNKSKEELATLVENAGDEDKELLRAIATQVGAKFSGNSGVAKLKESILVELIKDEEPDVDENDPVVQALAEKKAAPVVETPKPKSIMEMPRTALAKMDPRAPGLTEVEKRAIVRAKALRLHRVKVHNLDPSEAAVPGAIKTVFNKYLGKVSKYVPFGDENEHGYHLPECLINSLQQEKYTMRKEIKTPGSSFGVKQYRTVQMPRFNIEYMPELTEQELDALGQDQKARGAIDTTAA